MIQWLLWFSLVIVIVVGLGLLMARGRGGELPAVVDDRPQPRIPNDDFTAESLAEVVFATAGQGYRQQPIDDLLVRAQTAIADGDPAGCAEVSRDCVQLQFPVTSKGYQMTQVDAVLDKLAHQLGEVAAAATLQGHDEPEVVTEVQSSDEPQVVVETQQP